MTKTILIAAMLLAPVGALAFHFGQGQRYVANEAADKKLAAAQDAEKREEWALAVEAYAEALAALPPTEKVAAVAIRRAQANALIYAGELPTALERLETLLTELLGDATATPATVQGVRADLASAQYYAAWLMRLEGAETDEWTAQVDQSRQNFRLLAEESAKGGDAKTADAHQKNLESAIRLARMDLSELQGLKIPKKCQGCKNCSGKCNGQKPSQCNNPNGKKDARGASAQERPNGSGS